MAGCQFLSLHLGIAIQDIVGVPEQSPMCRANGVQIHSLPCLFHLRHHFDSVCNNFKFPGLGGYEVVSIATLIELSENILKVTRHKLLLDAI